MSGAELLRTTVVALAGFIASWWLVGRLRGYAVRRNLIDEVGARSSHTAATARGGGLAIVGVLVPLIVALPLWTDFPARWSFGMGVAGAAVAIVGWVDDHGHVAARYRLLVHFFAALVLVGAIGPVPLDWLGLGHPLIEWAFSAVLIAWLINLFNFMDGIDGLAASEAITAWGGLAVVLLLLNVEPGIAAAAWIGAAAVAGFLVWNWAPAKIFMGDVSSGFLGALSGALILCAAQRDIAYAAALAIQLGVFVVDATVTVLRRAARREPLHEPHRGHAYQILARRCDSHARVAVAAVMINLAFLLPVAMLAASHTLGPISAVLVAYSPLVLLALILGADSEERAR
jgi:Fuc2NAc and GlcNAc transferase